MLVRVKLFACWVELGHAVLGKCLEEFLLGHFNAVEERDEVFVFLRNGLVDVFERCGEDVDGGEEVGCKALDGKVLGGCLFLFCPALEVDKVGFAVCELALRQKWRLVMVAEKSRRRAHLELLDLAFKLLNLLHNVLGSVLDLVHGLLDLFRLVGVPSGSTDRWRGAGWAESDAWDE